MVLTNFGECNSISSLFSLINIISLTSVLLSIAKYTYKPGGSSTNHVVVFKIERNASLSHPLVQDCIAKAQTAAPHYWSERETKQAVASIQLLSDMNARLAYSKLEQILPENIVLNSSWNSNKKSLLNLTTALLLCPDSDADTASVVADLRKLNFGPNGDLDKSKFDAFFDAMNKVVELGGTGAHEKRHTQGDDVRQTTNIVYTTQFSSIEDVVSQTTKYMTDELSLKEGQDFHVPCLETVRLAFSPSHDCRALSRKFSNRLTVKLATRKKNARPRHNHAHYCAQAKKLYRLYLSQIRNLIEDDDGSEPFGGLRWEYRLKMYGLDDKASIKVVNDPDTPVAATTYNRARAVVPQNTEIHAADHDFTGTGKIVPSVIVDCNIGKDPSESLLSGGEDGNGMIFVAVHDGVFEKSDNYHHVASIVRLTRNRCINMLVDDKLLPETNRHVQYKDLCAAQRKIVDDAMPYVIGNEIDGGGDHSNTNFQNMCAYIGGFFLLRCDRYFISRGCPGHSYLLVAERAMPLLNLALSNHSCSIDPNAPDWVRRILQECSSLNQVRKAVALYDEELGKAIEFKVNNPMFMDSDDESEGDSIESEHDDEESVLFPEVPVTGGKVKKFVDLSGWYDGRVLSYIEPTKTVNVKLSNGSGKFDSSFAMKRANTLHLQITFYRGAMDY